MLQTWATRHYYFSDQLGSASVITDALGANPTRYYYYPYGGQQSTVGSDPNHYKFTGKERDAESGLDNFDFRYFGSSLGRFMSADDDSAQDPANPQSWNLYSYVMNNPTTNVDPDGHDCVYVGSSISVVRGDCLSDKDNGIYVNGTIDLNSFTYNPKSNSIGFSYSPDDAAPGTFGAGVIQQPTQRMDNGGISPGLLGPGDFILFSGVKTPAYVTEFFGKIFGSILGKGAEDAAETAAKQIVPDVDNLSNKIVRQMVSRGWTKQEILDTVKAGKAFPVVNKATGGAATEYVSASGKFVVVDNATKQVIQVSGPGFLPNHLVQ